MKTSNLVIADKWDFNVIHFHYEVSTCHIGNLIKASVVGIKLTKKKERLI